MNPSEVESSARSYIDAAIEVQKRDGRTPNVSKEDYERAVKKAAAALGELARIGRRSESAA